MFIFATGDFQSKSLLRLVDLKTEIHGTTNLDELVHKQGNAPVNVMPC